ncbi:MAG: hypothetical protein Q8R77_06215, partial [Sediminibacterium sp.]|nr:hypothetical protein [Sediminibacterium sp.]
KSCDAKLNYKIPVGLKLLSSQGPGVYDVASGVWDAGLLSVNDSVSLDLVLQATNIGYFVNMVGVYGDLSSTHAVAAKPIVKVFNGKWKSTAAMSDSNGGNNVASYSFDVRSPTYQTPSHEYKWPDLPDPTPTPQPTPTPKPDKEPQPTPQPDIEPPWDPQPKVSNDQLPRDIRSIRDVVSGVKDAKIANWNMTIKQPEPTKVELNEWESIMLKTGVEIFMLGAVSLIPNEWLREVQNGFVRAFESLGGVLDWLGFGKNVKQVTALLNKAHNKVDVPWMDKWLNRFSAVIDGLGPNMGMKIFEQVLVKLFPGASTEIKIFLNAFSVVQFAKDPFGTLNSIIDTGQSILAKSIPDPEDIKKVIIADFIQ